MWNLSRKGLWAHRRRVLGTGTAVILGVAFLVATLVLGDTVRAGFDRAFTEANAGTDVVVRHRSSMGSESAAQRGRLDASVVALVAGVDGVDRAVGTVAGVAQVVGADGEPVGGDGPPTVAASWIDDPALGGYRLAEGRAPAADDEVVLDRATARAAGLGVGDPVTVLTPAPHRVRVVGLARYGDEDSLGPVTYTGFTLRAAQELFLGGADAVSDVVVAARPGVSEDELAVRLAAVLPAEAEAVTAAELTAEQRRDIDQDFLGFFEAVLVAFAGVALLVATFSVYNTFSIMAAQRSRESALLRALGATRRQVLTSLGLESLAIGVVASAAGVLLGLGLSRGLLALLDASGMGMPSAGWTVEPASVVTALAVGVGVTGLAGVVPAVRASRVAPLAALRDVAVDRSGVGWRSIVPGAAALGLGAYAVVAAGRGDGDVAGAGLGALGCIVGLVVLGPAVARGAVAVLGAPAARLRGAPGALARRNAMRNPRRTSSTASALMVGVRVVTLFTVFAASLRTGVRDVVEDGFRGDLVITSEAFGGPGLAPGLAEELRARPEVELVSAMGVGALRLDGDVEEPAVVDAGLGALLELDVTAGSLAELGADGIAVSAEWADEHGVAVGDAVPAEFVDGSRVPLRVAAVYQRTQLMGDVVLGEGAWAPHEDQPAHTIVLVGLRDDVPADAGRAAVAEVAARWGVAVVQTAEEYIDEAAAQVDQVLTVVYGLLVLAIVIALMGIANTLALSIHERTRELGLLRAVGLTRGQTRSMVRWEAVSIAAFGTVGGVGLGVFLGWGLTRALGPVMGVESFSVPSAQLGVVLALGAVVGVVAARRPARRAARLDVLAAIATD